MINITESLKKLLSQMANWSIYFEQMDPRLFRESVDEHATNIRQILNILESKQYSDAMQAAYENQTPPHEQL